MIRWLVLCLMALSLGCQKPNERVVVYCAQDPEYAQRIFADFMQTSPLQVAPKFDTEANKSVGLVNDLIDEANRPRCDLHWNNEIVSTIRLAKKGMYHPFSPGNKADFPAWSRAKDGTWQAFASRARVIIVNTEIVPIEEGPRSIFDMTSPQWKGRVAIAKPQFGTTATHAACLWQCLGAEVTKQWFRDLKANDIQLAPGNKQVATGVADGRFALGLTDTDDAMIEVLAGKPVAIIFPDREGHPDFPSLGVLYIPNTLAVVVDAPNPVGAKMLMEYLLSPEVEAKLATGGGYQIPLNPKVQVELPKEILRPDQVNVMDVDFEAAAEVWEQAQEFIRDEFLR